MLVGKRPPAMQVAAICLDTSGQNVLLITSRGTGRWVIPKGWPMSGKTLAQAAEIEAWEEAGVRGEVSTAAIGSYSYKKDQNRGFAIPVTAQVYLLQVRDTADQFPEMHQRRRQWFPLEQAAGLVAEPGLRALFLRLAQKGAAA